jgi:hypothetical protein
MNLTALSTTEEARSRRSGRSWKLTGRESSPCPPCYDLHFDADMILLRTHGASVAAFSAKGATREGILEAAREDYRGLMEANAGILSFQGEDDNQKWSA